MVNAPWVFLTRLQLIRIVAVALLAGLAGVTGSAQQVPAAAYDPVGLDPKRAYFAQLPFEHVDMINGNLLLTFTDLALPGDAGMDLRLVRSYNHQGGASGVGWSFGIAGVPSVIENPDGPLPQDEVAHYPVLVTIGGGSRQTYPVNGPGDTVFVAEDFSRYTSTTRTLETPNGWVATYEAGDTPDRVFSRARLLQVRDSFGNTITPEWEPGTYRPLRLNAVVQTVSGATRRVELEYPAESSWLPTRMRLIGGGANGGDRVWEYDYAVVVPGTQIRNLTEVRPPSGAPWTFAYTYGGVEGTDTVVVTTPNGGIVSYGLPRRVFPVYEGVERPIIATRTTGGRGIASGTWNFEIGTPDLAGGRVTLPDGRVVTFFHEYDSLGWGGWRLLRKTLELADGSANASFTPEYDLLPVMQSSNASVVTKETVVQDGRSYVTDYSYSPDNFGDYHRPNKILESSGGRVRQIDRTYQHLSSPYLKGLVTSETITVGGESATSNFNFNGDGFLTQETVAGATTIFTPTAQGNRASSKDAR